MSTEKNEKRLNNREKTDIPRTIPDKRRLKGKVSILYKNFGFKRLLLQNWKNFTPKIVAFLQMMTGNPDSNGL